MYGWERSRGNYSVNMLRQKLSSSVVDPDPHSFDSPEPGSGSVLGMRTRI
jgi:hypothetical protein